MDGVKKCAGDENLFESETSASECTIRGNYLEEQNRLLGCCPTLQ